MTTDLFDVELSTEDTVRVTSLFFKCTEESFFSIFQEAFLAGVLAGISLWPRGMDFVVAIKRSWLKSVTGNLMVSFHGVWSCSKRSWWWMGSADSDGWVTKSFFLLDGRPFFIGPWVVSLFVCMEALLQGLMLDMVKLSLVEWMLSLREMSDFVMMVVCFGWFLFVLVGFWKDFLIWENK